MRKLFVSLIILVPALFVLLSSTENEKPAPGTYRRIVAMAPSYCETVAALGEAHRLVGVTRDCAHDDVKNITKIGSFADANFELILQTRPDLILAVPHTLAIQTLDRLEKLGIKIFAHQPDSLADIRFINEQIGALLNVQKKASLLNQRLDDALKKASDLIKATLKEKPSILFAIADSPLVVAGKRTFIAEIAEKMGFNNLAHESYGNWPLWPLEKLITAPPSFFVLLEGKESLPRYMRLFNSLNLNLHNLGSTLIVPDRPILFSPSIAIIEEIEYFSQILSRHSNAPFHDAHLL